MTRTATSIQQSEKHHAGLINNGFMKEIEVTANIEVIGLHMYSTALVIILLLVVFTLFVIWRMCKRKNMHKICHFICIRQCRYGEDMTDDPEASVAYSATGGVIVQNIPMDTSSLIQLANQMALNTAVAWIQSRSTTSSNTVPPPAAETTTNE